MQPTSIPLHASKAMPRGTAPGGISFTPPAANSSSTEAHMRRSEANEKSTPTNLPAKASSEAPRCAMACEHEMGIPHVTFNS
jgi:hypothetical protein